MPTIFKYEIFDEPLPNCVRGWFARYVDPLERMFGERIEIKEFDECPCQIDHTLPRSIISADKVRELMPNGHAMLSKKPINDALDPTAAFEPRPAEGEIILDLIISAKNSSYLTARDVHFIVDNNATIPLRIGQEILNALNVSYESNIIDGKEKRFMVFERE